jgi:hypothetical protein
MSPDIFFPRFCRRLGFLYIILIAFLANAGFASGMTAAGDAVGQDIERGFSPYAEFVSGLKTQGPAARGTALRTSMDDEARRYLLSLYDGVSVAHSFERAGQIYDCFAVADQPSVRLRGEAVAEPPPFSPPRSAGGVTAEPAGRDADGNQRTCAAGSVPIRRILPEEIARFGSLRRFFAKDLAGGQLGRSNTASPDARGMADLSGPWVGTETEPGAPAPHLNIALNLGTAALSGAFSGDTVQSDAGSVKYYAYAVISGKVAGNTVTFRQNGFYLQHAAPGTHWCVSQAKLTYAVVGTAQTLTGTLQGTGCKPATVKLTRTVYSHKYAARFQWGANLGGSSAISIWKPTLNPGAGQVFSLAQQWYVAGTGQNLQTAEVGWEEYPQKYQTFNPAFFIYWTADAYNQTGCYTTACPGFVVRDSSFGIGGIFPKYGLAPTGTYAMTVTYYLHKGAWWLAYEGRWIGYYPASLYGQGPMATAAASIDFGGETVGATSWPAMGSGRFASQANAAFQENISYYDLTGKRVSATLPIPTEPSPRCYTVGADIQNSGSYFLFGGPGGKGC